MKKYDDKLPYPILRVYLFSYSRPYFISDTFLEIAVGSIKYPMKSIKY